MLEVTNAEILRDALPTRDPDGHAMLFRAIEQP
jgi:hypothetical protein